ncbi:TPA: hypothetical protein ACGI1V_000037 [Staphylococcus argenteus]|nr:hypothetical protein [Staphylococcus argenteus]MCG9795682.1 hypothetical protein [Staphylococcus argenteus]MCG9803583.1 hypothetical protein [Staphylococcus argenteus]MCG9811088.1 hypothetical protein [Staphylococcus argenteus]MCG9823639.1 hypothetical protein [Staphylococcus argenteus]MCO5362032.1 hypothetical protein [Staphylococcus argenteus]
MADELILTIFRKFCINNEKERK